MDGSPSPEAEGAPDLHEKLAAGHMLGDDELDALRSVAAAEAAAEADELEAKLASGYMLTEEELAHLRSATSISARLTQDAITAKLVAGHMLSDDELEELRTSTVVSATATSDDLAQKLDAGYMLTQEEIASLKACTATIEAAAVDAIKTKLAQGHMLDASEVEHLRRAAGAARRDKPSRPCHGSARGQPCGEVRAGSATVRPHVERRSVAQTERLYAQADEQRKRDLARMTRAQSAHTRSQRELMRAMVGFCMFEPNNMSTAPVAGIRASTSPSRAALQSARTRRPPPATDDVFAARAPSAPRSARSAKPSPRALGALQKVSGGHILSPHELQQLRDLVASDEAEALLGRLKEGKLLSASEISQLQTAASTAGPVAPRARPVTSRTRARGALPPVSIHAVKSDPNEKALQALKTSAMALLADGVNIGNMRLSELISLDHPRLMRRHKESKKMGLRKAYGALNIGD